MANNATPDRQIIKNVILGFLAFFTVMFGLTKLGWVRDANPGGQRGIMITRAEVRPGTVITFESVLADNLKGTGALKVVTVTILGENEVLLDGTYDHEEPVRKHGTFRGLFKGRDLKLSLTEAEPRNGEVFSAILHWYPDEGWWDGMVTTPGFEARYRLKLEIKD